MKEKVLREKTDTESPLVRFDEGVVSPRHSGRAALLYATGKAVVCMSLAAMSVCRCKAARLDETFAGQTWYVSVYAPSGGEGTREMPFNTIQAAVDAASAGDTVQISEGVYRIGTTSFSTSSGFSSLSRVDVTKRLRIRGAGRDKTVIEGASSASGDADGCGSGAVRGFRIADSAAGTLIEKLTVVGGRTPSADVAQTTSDNAVSVTYAGEGVTNYIADIGANTAAKGGGVWYDGGDPVYLSDVTVEDCRAGYAGGGVCGNVVLLRAKVFHCRGGLCGSGAIYGITGAYSSWIVGCGGTAAGKCIKHESVLGFPKGAVACTFVNCTMSANLGCGIPNKLLGRNTSFVPPCSFYNCAFFDAAHRFIDNPWAFDTWNCAMNSNGSMPNNKNNIGGDWGTSHPNERHLDIDTSSHAAGPFDPYGTGYGWRQLVSPVNNARLRPGSALIGQGSNEWITVKGTFVPDEYVPYDFDGNARIQDDRVDMGAFEGGVPHGAIYSISTGNTYPISINGCPIDLSDRINYFSGTVGEHLTLEADTGEIPLFAFTTTELRVNGHTTSYRYLYPDGQSRKIDLVVDGAVASASYAVVPAASTIWVATNGNDSAAGTFDAPLRTLQKANDKSSANGVVFAKRGVYAEGEGYAATDSDWITTTKNRLTVTKNLRVCGVEGAEHTVIMGRHSTDTEGFRNNGCGAGALRCVGMATGKYVAIQGFTITGGATDSDPVGKNTVAGKTKSADDHYAYNWGAAGVCGWSYPSSGQNYMQVIDCVISNNVAYRNSALASVLARRCLITQNHTIDVLLETNALQNVGGLAIETSFSGCQIADNDDIDSWLLYSRHNVHNLVNNTIATANTGQKLFKDAYSGNFNNIFIGNLGDIAGVLAESSGNLQEPYLLAFDDGTFGVVAGTPAATAGKATNASFAAVFSGGRDNVWPDASAECPVGCFLRMYPGVYATASGGRGVTPIGWTGTTWGETVTLDASDMAMRQCLGFDMDGILSSNITSFAWHAYGFDDDPHVVRAIYSTNWYVNADTAVGSDSKNGWTPETPKRTLAAALALALNGDTVHVAPGRYDEGTMVQDCILVATPTNGAPWIRSRAYIREGVSLVADGTPEETVIVGVGHDDTETKVYEWGNFKLGFSNIRCVAMEKNTSLKGFTLTDGGTSHGTSQTDDTCGGGVLACGDLSPLIEDCIISNCFSTVGGGCKGGTYVRCRLIHLGAFEHGGAASGARLYGCYVEDCFDCPISGNMGLYNCTFGPDARLQFTGNPVNTLISDWNKPIVNCLILTETSGKYIRTYTCASNNLVCAAAGPIFGTSGSSVNNITNIPAANLAADAEGRPLAGSLAIDSGDNALLAEGLSAAGDLGGGQRIYNGAVDVGCWEYDWRPAFGAALGLVRPASVTKADPDVLLAAQGVEIKDGCLEVEFVLGGGVVMATAEVQGSGTLRAVMDNKESASVVAAQGKVNLVVRNPSGDGRHILRFAYEAVDGDGHGTMLSAVNWQKGIVLTFR